MTITFSHKLYQRPCFFDRGIRFACLKCGACCVGAPGTIYVSADEIKVIARHLDLDGDAFVREYCYPFKESYSITEDHQGRCRFFKEGCTIYTVRPLQCRTFPFWFSNIRSIERWRVIERQCPGIGAGRCYTRDEILSTAQSTMHI